MRQADAVMGRFSPLPAVGEGAGVRGQRGTAGLSSRRERRQPSPGQVARPRGRALLLPRPVL